MSPEAEAEDDDDDRKSNPGGQAEIDEDR